MFSRNLTAEFTKGFSEQIRRLKEALESVGYNTPAIIKYLRRRVRFACRRHLSAKESTECRA